MSNIQVKNMFAKRLSLNGTTYTCNGERQIIDGKSMWLYKTRKGLELDVIACSDQFPDENSEYYHLTAYPGEGLQLHTESSPEPQGPSYLTFTANENSCAISLDIEGSPQQISLEYSTDGTTWNEYTWNAGSGQSITLENQGDYVMFRGVNSEMSDNIEDRYYFSITGSVSASGDLTSLINGEGGDVPVPEKFFYGLFHNCTGLTTAPALPSTTLAANCYNCMFQDCTSLTEIPELPATTLAANCYNGMFLGCTALVTAPELPATTLAANCYNCMFQDCTSLVNAPALSATTLAEDCYKRMFQYCTSLVTAPELPATTLAANCYIGMFSGCTSLTEIPELPATTLAEDCYNCMFSGCTALTEIPELPATTLAANCYNGMFQDCTSLVTAPELPATTLAANCYDCMFLGCTSLTEIPELPATTLAEDCYNGMFLGCTGLTGTIELSATTLDSHCYDYMFSGCTSLTGAILNIPDLVFDSSQDLSGQLDNAFYGCSLLNSVQVGFSSFPSDGYDESFYCTGSWLYGVAQTGTFTWRGSQQYSYRSASTIPNNWTIVSVS